jgi:serine/threonine protein kinase
MEEEHLSERKVKYYLCHVLIALYSLHAAGIIHREVDPQNMPII